MSGDSLRFVVILKEPDGFRLVRTSEEIALTLRGTVSEDPTCWEDLACCWPRYRTPVVPEFADALPVERVEFDAIFSSVKVDDWLVIDMVNKRMTTGCGFEELGRDCVLALEVDESGRQRFPLSIHLPPWWELMERVEFREVVWERENPSTAPRVNRELLYGNELIEFFSARILDAVESGQWTPQSETEFKGELQTLTIQMHRDWLMTPRDDLGGQIPRRMLHGGISWIDCLVHAQQIRCSDGGAITALPVSFSDYESAPMGREEIVIYFDLCRELISAGWEWCLENDLSAEVSKDRAGWERKLVAHLSDVKQWWLTEPFEGGSVPEFVIECSRRRVPRGAGLPIEGMTERESEMHVIDCDCPTCNMMADGAFGPSFAGLDGHHLELDDEFAFSLCETREEWELQQREYEEMSARIQRDMSEQEARESAEAEPFESPWAGLVSDDPLPGDPQGHLKLAFLLTEVVSALNTAEARGPEIKRLNELFDAFRQAENEDRLVTGGQLNAHLEALSANYPELVPRLADLQSRIDEQLRSSTPGQDDVLF